MVGDRRIAPCLEEIWQSTHEDESRQQHLDWVGEDPPGKRHGKRPALAQVDAARTEERDEYDCDVQRMNGQGHGPKYSYHHNNADIGVGAPSSSLPMATIANASWALGWM